MTPTLSVTVGSAPCLSNRAATSSCPLLVARKSGGSIPCKIIHNRNEISYLYRMLLGGGGVVNSCVVCYIIVHMSSATAHARHTMLSISQELIPWDKDIVCGAYIYNVHVGFAVLLRLVCLFDLTCFFLSSFSSLIKTCMYMYVTPQ